MTFKNEELNHRLAIEFTFEAGILSFKNTLRGSSLDSCLVVLDSIVVYGADMDSTVYYLEALNNKYLSEVDKVIVS